MSRTSTENVASLTTGFSLPRVNLLPPEVHQARKLRRLQVGLGAGLAGLVVVLGAAYLVEDQSSHQAADDVAGVQAQSVTLNAQKAQYADVPQTLSAIDAAETARQTAMTDDIAWYRYLNDLSYVTPANTWLTQLTVNMAGASGATTGAASAPAVSSATPSIATITFAGTAKNHNDVASWLDAIAKEKGWTNVYFTNSTAGSIGSTPIVTFASSASVNSAALSHRYDKKDG
jgi:Tfp pilus assembly protein PilN